MTELATAYISIVPETSKIAPGIRGALRGVDGQGAAAGKSMGSRMADALGKSLKVGVATAGAAAVGTATAAMVKGFQRLDAIDQAEGKLAGLGHTAQGTAVIMDSALASVKGTAYGLGDAATIAASAVAAGIKPGEDLTNYLSMTADAAAIAGTELSEMGSILNQVQTGQMAYSDNLNMLADRGIPIYQWLAEEAGVAAGEVKKLAADGKISSEMFFEAIEKNIGGAALKAGETVRGGLNNAVAALGRLGAEAQKPFFERLPGQLASVTGGIDELTPRVGALASVFADKIFEDWGPRLGEAFDELRDSGAIERAASVLGDLGGAVVEIAPAVGEVAAELGRATAALGVSGWQLFLTTVEAGTVALEVLNPILSTTADLMADNQGAVTALVAAYLGFKTLPTIVDKLNPPIKKISDGMAGVGKQSTGIIENAGAWRELSRELGDADPKLSMVQRHMMALETSPGVLGRMSTSFTTASDGAKRFSTTAGAAAASWTGLKSGIGGVVNMLGGPANVAIGGATVALTLMATQLADNRQKAEAQTDAVEKLTEAQDELGRVLMVTGGAMDDQAWDAATEAIAAYEDRVSAAADTHRSFTESTKTNMWKFAVPPVGLVELFRDQNSATQDSAEAALEAASAYRQLGVRTEDVARAVYGSDGQFADLAADLVALGDGGRRTAADLGELRDEYLAQRDAAARVVPGITQFDEALRILGDTGASSSDKLNALKASMDALNPARSEVEAQIQHAEAVRRTAEAAEKLDETAFDASGALDATTVAGAGLSRAMMDLVDKTAGVISSGGDVAGAIAENEAQFEALAEATGKPVEAIRALYAELGGQTLDLAMGLHGADEVVQDLAAVQLAFDEAGGDRSIEIDAEVVGDAAIERLRELGHTVEELDDDTVKVTVNTAEGELALQMLTRNVHVLGALRAEPTLDLNTVEFDARDAEAVAALEELDTTHVAPEAMLTIEELLDGQSVSMAALQELHDTTAHPKTKLEIEELMRKLTLVNQGLDDAAKPRDAWINIRTRGEQIAYAGRVADLMAQMNAQGSIRTRAAGGIDMLRDPVVKSGRGAGELAVTPLGPVQWAEGETDGEAFIPFAQSKRRRSTDLLAGVADIFGFALLPKQVLGDSLSGTLGGVAGALSADAISATGVNGFRTAADGGIFRDLAEGKLGNRPLTGSPYDWGGVHWGDCSGAGSAFARLWAGLDPFGGRTGTAGAASYFAELGLTRGRGGPGDLVIGFYNGGPGGGHMTTRLPTGENAEMGGANGGGMLGGSASSPFEPQYTDHWHGKVDARTPLDWSGVGDDEGGYVTRGRHTGGRGGSYDTGGGSTISGMFGDAIGAGASGFLADALGVFGINDSPGWLAGATEAERALLAHSDAIAAAEQAEADAVADHASKQRDELGKYEEARTKLGEQLRDGTIEQADHDKELAELEADHADTMRELDAELRIARDAARRERAIAAGGGREDRPRDPGTRRPAPGEDLGVGTPAGKALADEDLFDRGGVAHGLGMMPKGVIAPERVLDPRETRAFEKMVDAQFTPTGGADMSGVERKLDQLITLLSAHDFGSTHVTLRDDREFYDRQKRLQHSRMAAAGGGKLW